MRALDPHLFFPFSLDFRSAVFSPLVLLRETPQPFSRGRVRLIHLPFFLMRPAISRA